MKSIFTSRALKRRSAVPLFALAMAGCGIGAPIICMLSPPSVSIPSGARASDSQTLRSKDAAPDIDPAVRSQALARLYRLPLFDPPPPEPTPVEPPAPPPPLPVQLVATMVAQSGNQAMFTDANGRVFIRAEGDRLGDDSNSGEILDIDRHGVVIKYFDEELKLTLSNAR